MISNLFIILSIVFLGILCRKKAVFKDTHIEGFELFLLKIAIPCYLFAATLRYNLSSLLYIPYIYSYLLSFLTIGLIVISWYWRCYPVPNIAMIILASGYVNTAIYALPIVEFLLGNPEAAILSNLLQVVIIQSSFITLWSFLCHKEKTLGKKVISSISTPIVALPVIGLLLNWLQFMPHSVVITVVNNLGTGVASLSLFTFGLNIRGFSKKAFDKDLLLVILTKNILHPIVAFSIGNYIFHLERYWLYSIVIIASSPTAFVVYLFSKQYSIEKNLIKKVMTVSAIVSLLSLIFITYMFFYN